VIVDRENLAHALPAVDGVHDVDVFARLARQEVELEDAAVYASTIRCSRQEGVGECLAALRDRR
jgi:hypothetical protein